jgi:hypothetical protein
VKTNTGLIRKTSRWRVNRIDFDVKKDTSINWICESGNRFWILVPIGTVPGKKDMDIVVTLSSKNGKAFLPMKKYHLGKIARGEDNPFFYAILVKDGKKMQYVHGTTPPRIIIWGSSPK